MLLCLIEDRGEANGRLSNGVVLCVQVGDGWLCTCLACCSLSFVSVGYAYKLFLIQSGESLLVSTSLFICHTIDDNESVVQLYPTTLQGQITEHYNEKIHKVAIIFHYNFPTDSLMCKHLLYCLFKTSIKHFTLQNQLRLKSQIMYEFTKSKQRKVIVINSGPRGVT
jgi:hypothetical protein